MQAMANIKDVIQARKKASAQASSKDTTGKNEEVTVKEVASNATLSPEQAKELRGALERMRQESTSDGSSQARNTQEVLAWLTHSDHMCADPVSIAVPSCMNFMCVIYILRLLFSKIKV